MPIKNSVKGDEMADILRDAILSGELKPRERLVEADLANKYEVSRTPIREAINRLAALNLVKVEPFKGAIVADIDVEEIRDIYIVRANLEALAAKLATTRIPELEFDNLRNCITNMEAAEKDLDLLTFSSENIRFHRIIYGYCGNKFLIKLIDDMLDRTESFRKATWQNRRNVQIAMDGHREILAALEERDEKKVREASEKHVRLFIADKRLIENHK